MNREYRPDGQVRIPVFLERPLIRAALALLAGDVTPGPEQAEAFIRLADICDEPADALVAGMRRLPSGVGRRLFEQALEHGIESVEDPFPELVEFFRVVDEVPPWVDFDILRTAHRVLSMVPQSTLTRTTISLVFPLSYVAGRANEVLIRGGDLAEKAPRRLVETVNWIFRCTDYDGMTRYGEGFKATVRVRVVHAYVRAGMNALPEWNHTEWGRPVNQLHMTVTMLPIVLAGLLNFPLGHLFTRRECDALLHQYRYMAHVMGVVPELQIRTLADLARLTWLAAWSEIDPGPHARPLTAAAFAAVGQIYGLDEDRGFAAGLRLGSAIRSHTGLTRAVTGRALGDELGVPRISPVVLLELPRIATNTAKSLLRLLVPPAGRRLTEHGARRRRRDMDRMNRRVAARLDYRRDNAVGAVADRHRALREPRTDRTPERV
ncbi:oxygenase MpaB family protein [Nocardia sp. X0981]